MGYRSFAVNEKGEVRRGFQEVGAEPSLALPLLNDHFRAKATSISRPTLLPDGSLEPHFESPDRGLFPPLPKGTRPPNLASEAAVTSNTAGSTSAISLVTNSMFMTGSTHEARDFAK